MYCLYSFNIPKILANQTFLCYSNYQFPLLFIIGKLKLKRKVEDNVTTGAKFQKLDTQTGRSSPEDQHVAGEMMDKKTSCTKKQSQGRML